MPVSTFMAQVHCRLLLEEHPNHLRAWGQHGHYFLGTPGMPEPCSLELRRSQGLEVWWPAQSHTASEQRSRLASFSSSLAITPPQVAPTDHSELIVLLFVLPTQFPLPEAPFPSLLSVSYSAFEALCKVPPPRNPRGPRLCLSHLLLPHPLQSPPQVRLRLHLSASVCLHLHLSPRTLGGSC